MPPNLSSSISSSSLSSSLSDIGRDLGGMSCCQGTFSFRLGGVACYWPGRAILQDDWQLLFKLLLGWFVKETRCTQLCQILVQWLGHLEGRLFSDNKIKKQLLHQLLNELLMIGWVPLKTSSWINGTWQSATLKLVLSFIPHLPYVIDKSVTYIVDRLVLVKTKIPGWINWPLDLCKEFAYKKHTSWSNIQTLLN